MDPGGHDPSQGHIPMEGQHPVPVKQEDQLLEPFRLEPDFFPPGYYFPEHPPAQAPLMAPPLMPPPGALRPPAMLPQHLRLNLALFQDEGLRQQAAQHAHLPPDTLLSVLPIPRTPAESERHRQLFAMCWLLRCCEVVLKAVVPRLRVYAGYAQTCSQLNQRPLSAVSVGKLVHVLFPRLTTRRLGVRGQSKYHYCGLRLKGEGEPSPLHTRGVSSISGTPHRHMPQPSLAESEVSLALPDSVHSTPVRLSPLRSRVDAPLSSSDPDAASTLRALYHTFLQDLARVLDHWDRSRFATAVTTLHNSLTLPVARLYHAPETQAWAARQEARVYREAVAHIGAVVVLPEADSEAYATMSRELVPELSLAVESGPRVAAASEFARLVARAVRVISARRTAHAILNDPSQTAQMLADWQQLDLASLVWREAPCGEGVRDILVQDVPRITASAAALDAAEAFIPQLFERFRTDPRWVVLVLSNLWTVALREMSMAGAGSFWQWWAVRGWIDEYTAWVGDTRTVDPAVRTPRRLLDSFSELLESNFGTYPST